MNFLGFQKQKTFIVTTFLKQQEPAKVYKEVAFLYFD